MALHLDSQYKLSFVLWVHCCECPFPWIVVFLESTVFCRCSGTLLFNYSVQCAKGKRYLTRQCPDSCLMLVRSHPSSPWKYPGVPVLLSVGSLLLELLFMQEEEQACFTLPEVLVLWYKRRGFWEGQKKHTELKAGLVATFSSQFILTHLLVNCHCFKRK